jgi:hypothetical protein
MKAGGAHPVAIATDGLAFLTDKEPTAFVAGLGLPIGTRLGQYEVERSFPASAMLDALDALRDAGKDAKRLSEARGAVLGLITGKDKADG